jgi:hypothetical protein
MEYSAESHRGITGVSVAQIKGGGVENVTKVQTTDGGDAPIEEYTEAPSTPASNGLPNAG